MIKATDFLYLKGTIRRYPYFLAGFLLFALKYNLDRFISYHYFNRQWFIMNYLAKPDILLMQYAGRSDFHYYLILGLTAVPFIWCGTVLTVKRLRDASLPLWMVGFFFIPFINFLFFSLFSILPSKQLNHVKDESQKNDLLDRLIPESNLGNALVAVGAVAVLSIMAAIFSIHILREYGWGLFIGIPFFLGLGSTLLYGYHRPRSYKESLVVSLLSVLLFGILLLVLAIEGVICIVMAAPLGIILGFLGATIGYPIQKRNLKDFPVLVAIFGFIPGMSLLENSADTKPPLVSVTTEIVINKPPQVIWNNLVSFNEMKAPAELIFRSGIAYPIKAEIKGKGVGAVRNCIFTTGAFVEPIEVWNEPKLLKFSVAAMPPPMVEISFYKNLNIPHLEGFFVSEKGQFVLIPLGTDRTKLQGTTWYRHNIWPGSYWKLWSDFILHKIHLRVLNHIKDRAERLDKQ